MAATNFSVIDSPLGPLVAGMRDGALVRLAFPRNGVAASPPPHWRRDDGALAELSRQLGEYFAGERTDFSIAFDLAGEPFARRVWDVLKQIPYGETLSYGEVAKRIGESAAAARAVGTACGENPVPIVVPCHRVIGADGALVGFGGGLAAKRFLLTLERRVRPRSGAQMDLFG